VEFWTDKVRPPSSGGGASGAAGISPQPRPVRSAICYEDVPQEDFPNVSSSFSGMPAEVRVIHAIRKKPATVSELAATLRRDRKAVKRDVTLLESFGLVNAREEINPGHGRKKIIEPRAAKYQLVATI